MTVKPVNLINSTLLMPSFCREKLMDLIRNLIQDYIFCNETKSLKTTTTVLAVWSIKSQHWPNVVGYGCLMGGFVKRLPGP